MRFAARGEVTNNPINFIQRSLTCITRYVNMDYIVLSTLIYAGIKFVVLLYDIACQYGKNFRKRLDALPICFRISDSVEIRFAIPKFHLPGHGDSCQTRYSLNFLPFVGRTYGEGVESEWAHINSLSTSSRKMAPGMRHKTLIAHWSSWNWSKTIGFGKRIIYLEITLVLIHKQLICSGKI